MDFKLERVHYMPKALEPGILYFAEEYGAAAHLCACGCGTKIRTPIGPTEWQIEDGIGGVSLCPSVGNWQQPCRSHYWIAKGEVRWSVPWTDDQVLADRAREAARRERHFAGKQSDRRKEGFLRRMWKRLTRWSERWPRM